VKALRFEPGRGTARFLFFFNEDPLGSVNRKGWDLGDGRTREEVRRPKGWRGIRQKARLGVQEGGEEPWERRDQQGLRSLGKAQKAVGVKNSGLPVEGETPTPPPPPGPSQLSGFGKLPPLVSWTSENGNPKI
jgi:hypothetical protein